VPTPVLSRDNLLRPPGLGERSGIDTVQGQGLSTRGVALAAANDTQNG
jgi:hypothetical protein